MSTTAEAVRALDVSIKHERMILGVGDAEDQSALDMAEVVKRESERWLKTVDVPPSDEATDSPDQVPE
jgi:hypothetical protein